jgi:hypothetical protein
MKTIYPVHYCLSESMCAIPVDMLSVISQGKCMPSRSLSTDRHVITGFDIKQALEKIDKYCNNNEDCAVKVELDVAIRQVYECVAEMDR